MGSRTRHDGRACRITGTGKKGRSQAQTVAGQIKTARRLLADPHVTVSEVAASLGANRSTIYRSLGLGNFAKGQTR